MKYGIIIADQIIQREVNYINIGDDFQNYAILCLFAEMGINSGDIIMLNASELRSYTGEYVILPINYYVEDHSSYDIFPLSPNIIPVFLGLHYRGGASISPEICDYFKQYQPIGCRDEYTLHLLRNNGIQAYLFGCITLTIPQALTRNSAKKIICVDTPESIYTYIPKELTDMHELEITSHIIYGDDFPAEKRNEILNEYIRKYTNEAFLIVTSRLHCISPCIALGVPVIAAMENRSYRMSWIDKLIPLYTKSSYKEISWKAKPIFIEDIKTSMKAIAKARIKETVDRFEQQVSLSYYWENRKKNEYGNAIREILERSIESVTARFDYIIWGTGSVGKSIFEIVEELYPNSNLLCAVDTYATGLFYGKTICPPEVRYDFPDSIIFVASYSGRNEIESLLIADGKQKDKDYVMFALTTG